MDNLKANVALHTTCTTTSAAFHKTLRVTPAMEAGKADHVLRTCPQLEAPAADYVSSPFRLGEGCGLGRLWKRSRGKGVVGSSTGANGGGCQHRTCTDGGPFSEMITASSDTIASPHMAHIGSRCSG